MGRPPARRSLILDAEETGALKSFRNIPRIHVAEVGAIGVADVIGAASLVISEGALEKLEGAARLMDPRTVIIRPVVSEKSYALIAEGKYTFRVNDRAHKTQVAHAVEEIFDVKVAQVRTSKVRSKPKRRGLSQRPHPGLEEGDRPARAGRTDRALRRRRDRVGESRCRTAKQNRRVPGAASPPTRCASR